MQHRSDGGVVWTNRAIGCVTGLAVAADDPKGGFGARRRNRASQVDLVTVKFVRTGPHADERGTTDLRADLGGTLGSFEAGPQGQQAEALGCELLGFDAVRVLDAFTEHLTSAADTERQAPGLGSLSDRAVKSEATQPGEVAHRGLGRGKDHRDGA